MEALKIKKLLVFLSIICFAGGAIYFAFQFDELPPILRRGLQPATFPIICSFIIIFLAAIMLFRIENDNDISDAVFNVMTLKIFMVICLFVVLLKIDFFFALALSSVFIHIIWTKSIHVKPIFFLGFLVPIFVYALFGQILAIRFPDGLITQFIYG